MAESAAKGTPPFPRDGTDLETSIREKQEYMIWMYENAKKQEFVVLKLKPGIESLPRQLISRAKAHEIGSIARTSLEPHSLIGMPNWQVFRIPVKMTEKAINEELCVKLKQSPDVLECDSGGSGYTFGVPTDTRYGEQWSLGSGPGGSNVEKAWDITTGAATTVVAILDSGISAHEDLASQRILPGYDFVSDPVVANDGGGRDASPSDPGNWVTNAESAGSGSLRYCKVENSDWHGTHVAGVIGASTNGDNKGVAGINWAAKLLPIRVMGKCGSPVNLVPDLTDAILWAAGVDIGTAATNPNPAQVINMSLSGRGACPTTVQAAIDEATKRGAVVVASAGNDKVFGSFWPADCKNVLTVAATDTVGAKASFSNWGGGVGVSAPGTNILSTANPGTTVPLAGSAYVAMSGTSQAAAHVSGIASLMLAANPKLTPFEIREMIKASAKPFARGSTVILGDCGSGSCGTGIVNGAQAIKLAKQGTPIIASEIELGRTYFDYLLTTMPTGTVVAWGAGSLGQLGAAGTNVSRPALVAGLANVDRVFAGISTTWLILDNGQAYAVGQAGYCSPYYDLLHECQETQGYFSFFGGNPREAASSSPVRTPILDNVKQIVVGQNPMPDDVIPSVFAISAAGQVLAWGYDYNGLLGLGLPAEEVSVVQSPTVIAGLPPVRKISTTAMATYVVDQSGNVWGWGHAGDGPCNPFGVGASDYSTVPRRLGGISNVVDVKSHGPWNSVALKDDGTVWQWGCGGTPDPTPLQVALDRVVAVEMMVGIGYAILSDGSLWRWNQSAPMSPVGWWPAVRWISCVAALSMAAAWRPAGWRLSCIWLMDISSMCNTCRLLHRQPALRKIPSEVDLAVV